MYLHNSVYSPDTENILSMHRFINPGFDLYKIDNTSV